MSPFGGEPSRFADYTPERNERMGRFFRGGTFSQEVVGTYAVDGMIVLATIERCNVAVGKPAETGMGASRDIRVQARGVAVEARAPPCRPVRRGCVDRGMARFARGERGLAAK